MKRPLLADTHCHIQAEAFDADREAVLARALDELVWLVVVGDDLPSSERAATMAGERVFATVGLHPHNASQWNANVGDSLKAMAARSGVVALGEIGLDYHYDFSPREVQREAFSAQLALACEIRIPVVIHCREAEEDLMACIAPYLAGLPGVLMHCFGGDAAFAAQCVELGFHVSFAGNVTFPKAEPLRGAARVVPIDRLLVETDSPYLAPKPFRGKRCEPVFVEHTARCLAEVKEIPFEELALQTTKNAERFFGITPRA